MSQVRESHWPSTSPDLLFRIRDGDDSAAWQRFVQQYTAVMRQVCLRRGLQYADAEDVVQQVLLAVSRQIAAFKYSPERARFRTWLGTLLIRGVWKTRHKVQTSREVLVDSLDEFRIGDLNDWVGSFGEAIFDVALQTIQPEFSHEEWNAFEQTWRNHEENATVADSLKRPVGWVYQARFRILKRLRQQVEILAEDLASPAQFGS